MGSKPSNIIKAAYMGVIFTKVSIPIRPLLKIIPILNQDKLIASICYSILTPVRERDKYEWIVFKNIHRGLDTKCICLYTLNNPITQLDDLIPIDFSIIYDNKPKLIESHPAFIERIVLELRLVK